MKAALARATAPLQESLQHAAELDPINRVSYLEARCYMLNTLLRDSDVMSMAHGLELRVPLIDHQLADKLMTLPGAWKLDDNVPKPLLVGALKGTLPDEIVHRKKQGFTLPFERWLRENLRPEVEAALQKVGQRSTRTAAEPGVASCRFGMISSDRGLHGRESGRCMCWRAGVS